MRRLTLPLAGAMLALALPALSQTVATTIRVRGTVVSMTADSLVIKTREGVVEPIALTPSWSVTLVKPVDVSTIQPGSFIGTTEVDKGDGTGRSLEVHVFPPGVKMGEGHYDWDLKPNSKMTNGTVGKVVVGHKGQELDVAYPGGTRHVVVPKKVPVVLMTPGDRAMVHPGAHLFIIAGHKPDGGLIAYQMVTGVDGAAPPM
jgi:hypothetical protein